MNRISSSLLLITASLLLILATWCAGDETGGLKVWGTLQNDFLGVQTFGGDFRDQFGGGGAGTLTFNIKNRNSTNIKIEGSADLMLFYGGLTDIFYQMQTGALRLSGSNTTVLFNLNKFYAGFFMPVADIFVGRQIINYGVGTVFSPVDVFSTVNVFDLSLKRNGSDVVRVRIPFSSTSGAEITGGTTSSDRKGTGALKVYGTWHGFDLSAIGIYKRAANEIITGLTFKGDLLVGIYGELAEHCGTDGEHRCIVGMIGADYSINKEWFFNAEYLYSQRNAAFDTISQMETVLSGAQAIGEHNLYLCGRYTFNELSSAGLSAITDLEKGSGFITAQYSRNILQNANMIVYGRYLLSGVSGIHDKIPDMQYGLRLEAKF